LTRLQKPSRWAAFLRDLVRLEWVVYSKPPFGGPEQVLKYLARYTHRVAISNQRLVSFQEGKVTFHYKDYRCGNLERTMTLEASEFIRRFLQHVLPNSFHRIRYYGFLANRRRKENVALARRLLGGATGQPGLKPQVSGETSTPLAQSETEAPHKNPICTACKKGRLVLVETFAPHSSVPISSLEPLAHDTS